MRKRYLIIVLISFTLCAVIAVMSHTKHRQGKTLVMEDQIIVTADTYESVRENTVRTSAEGTININTASAQEIAEFLPGIGSTKAENIVAYRKAIGGFKSVEELIEVSGIGESTLNSIRDYCRISDD